MPETHEKPRVGNGVEWQPARLADHAADLPRHAELHCISNFSFQRGASHPQELVWQAWDLGYDALAITDECSLAGVVRAWSGLKDYARLAEQLEKHHPGHRYVRHDFRLVYGSEFDFGDGRLVALVRDMAGWSGLCEFISAARMHSEKGSYDIGWERSDLSLLAGCQILFAPRRFVDDAGRAALIERLSMLQARFADRLWLAVEQPGLADDSLWLATLRQASEATGVRLVAAGGVQMHVRSRKPMQDVISAVRLGKPVADCGQALEPNAERHLRRRMMLARIYPRELMDETLKVIGACTFRLEELRPHYNFPEATVPEGMTPAFALRHLTWRGAHRRFEGKIPYKIRRSAKHELDLILTHGWEMFFLTVRDIVNFAEDKGILCQGRGSAANSIVCYCLGITAADPRKSHPLLERFISENRKDEPPDIDVDFEHERREEVIQYIYNKYGRQRAAIAAVVIGYRTRSAIRDVGMALNVPEPLIEAFAREHFWFDDTLAVDKLGALAQMTGIDLPRHTAALWLELVETLKGFPRHLSQHVGGFVLTEKKLTSLVPVENAAMKDRSIIQWDKDDLEDMGLLKIDVLALGMLTALRRCLDFRQALTGESMTLRQIPQDDDEKTFRMIRAADTVGVFQIESRAQMSMLPRLKPKVFYDLVVEVAIVRPGPIQGGMVHPYLRARALKPEQIEYEKTDTEKRLGLPSRLQKALKRTLGVPIFQEQVMEIAMLAANFTGAEADGLRRSMAAWKRKGGVERWRDRLIGGMRGNGYAPEFAERIFQQMLGFGEYGFPESHAFSFALLAWASSWLKCHEPDCFLAALLNSHPMGFYSPSQLIQDATRSGIEVRAADVSHSDWDCTLETASGTRCSVDGRPLRAVRVGLRLVGSFNKLAAERIVQARAQAPFADAEDLALRAALEPREMHALASADALASLSGHRRQQIWDAAAHKRPSRLLHDAPLGEAQLCLPAAPEGEEIVFDYAALGFTLRRHPLALLRERLGRRGIQSASDLAALRDGQRATACGIVTVRQQPQTANGTIFVTLEDETGPVNVIVWRRVREAQRDALLRSRLLAVRGTWQRDEASDGRVSHLVAERLVDLTPLLGRLGQQASKSRDFH
ncbi:MAG: error-prone DNA polymerase [Burkholderiales bacterium]|nr:error-prone DNA polymerase [Burkholderiales bacterium]